MAARRSSRLRSGAWAAVPALLVAALLASCDGPAGGDTLPPDREELEAATILTENTDTGTATLEDGEFRAPVAPGSASELVITLTQSTVGDLNGDGVGDAAAITVEEPGGSGRFRILHALLRVEGELHDADAAFLGDRIRVEGVAIHDGVIMVFMLDRPPDAPFADVPSIPVIRKFRLAGETLEELESIGGQVEADAAPACDDSLPDAALVIVSAPASGEWRAASVVRSWRLPPPRSGWRRTAIPRSPRPSRRRAAIATPPTAAHCATRPPSLPWPPPSSPIPCGRRPPTCASSALKTPIPAPRRRPGWWWPPGS